jgi:hypothetical protein
MQRSSEFPLFVQTSVALFAFLLLVSLFSWNTPSQSAHQGLSSHPAGVTGKVR